MAAYLTQARNTLHASWLTLLMAHLFGKRIEERDGGRRVVMRRWRGVTYLVDITCDPPAVGFMTGPARAYLSWPALTVARFRDDWRAGMAVTDMAVAYGVAEETVRATAGYLGLAPRGAGGAAGAGRFARPATDRSKAKKRSCLMCGKPFRSSGPGNRICGPCKGTRAWRDSGDYALALPATRGFSGF